MRNAEKLNFLLIQPGRRLNTFIPFVRLFRFRMGFVKNISNLSTAFCDSDQYFSEITTINKIESKNHHYL